MEVKRELNLYNENSNEGFFLFYSNVIRNTTFKRFDKSQPTTKDKSSHPQGKVIYDKGNITITYSNPTLETYFPNMYVVADPNDAHRYFVALPMSGDFYTDKQLHGIFLYFNLNDGNTSKVVILSKVCLRYDARNGSYNENNTFLFNQCLIFVGSHRDTRQYHIDISCFDYHDGYIASTIDRANIHAYWWCSMDDRNYIYQQDRWLILKEDNAEGNVWLLDMASLCVEKNVIVPNKYTPDRCMKYDIYKLKRDDCVDEFIQKNNTKPTQPYGEEYCTHCIKCGQITAIACYYEDNMTMGLGRSYCHDCNIRYSLSEKRWICAKLQVRTDTHRMAFFCGKPVDAETQYTCCNDHRTEELVFDCREAHNKPYKRDGSLRIKKVINK